MIYNNSTAPVLLKKINLKVWSLKDEIAHYVYCNIDKTDEESLIKSLIDEYAPEKPKLRLIKSEEGESEVEPEENKTPEAEASEPDKEETAQDDSKNLSSEEITQKIAKLPNDKKVRARTIMSEIGMEEIYFFCHNPFVEGQSIVVEFCVPQKFIMNADITFCQPYSGSNRVIGEGKLPYRVCARFSFLRPGERTLLRKFLTAIEPTAPGPSDSTKSKEDENDGMITEDMFEESLDEATQNEETDEQSEGKDTE